MHSTSISQNVQGTQESDERPLGNECQKHPNLAVSITCDELHDGLRTPFIPAFPHQMTVVLVRLVYNFAGKLHNGLRCEKAYAAA